MPATKGLRETFLDPPAEFGPVPLWWWVGETLEKPRLAWQLDQLRSQGINSVCVVYHHPPDDSSYSLVGDPPLFSPQWWEMFEWAVGECKKRGMTIWFSTYIKDNNALRDIEGNYPDLRGRHIMAEQKIAESGHLVEMDLRDRDIVAIRAYPLDGQTADVTAGLDLTDSVKDGILRWTAPKGRWLAFNAYAIPAWVDITNPEIGEALLKELYRRFEQHLGDEMGKTFRGFFADELWIKGGRVWSQRLVEEFKRIKGYDLVGHLPALWMDIGPMTAKVRIDYRDAATTLVEEGFFKPLSEFMEQHGMLYSHDQVGRRTIRGQTWEYLDYFRTMRWYSAPGYDDPGRGPVGQRNFPDSKLASSIANLYGCPRVWVEAFHSSGWGATLEQFMKWSNENYVRGANLYNKHGLYYTTFGGWWEWAPPSACFRQPYWQHHKHFATYICRLSWLLRRGAHACDVAVLYPATTMHALCSFSGSNSWVDGYGEEGIYVDETLWALGKSLFNNGIDFDYVDHQSIDRSVLDKGRMRVAGIDFKVLIFPAASALRYSNLEKALAFYRSGGVVIAYGRLPAATDRAGSNDPQVREIVGQLFGITATQQGTITTPVVQSNTAGGVAAFVPDGYELVSRMIDENIERDFKADREGINVLHRRGDGQDIYFVYNANSAPVSSTVTFRSVGDPEIWDALTGAIAPLDVFRREDAATSTSLALDSGEAKLVVFGPQEQRPFVESTDLDTVESVVDRDSRIQVVGSVSSGGPKNAVVRVDDKELTVSGECFVLPEPVDVDGLWSFRLEPTLDNRWGDFRLPRTQEMIGAEARRFRYRQEAGDPTDQDWHAADYVDVSWRMVTYSYGPQFWKLGPIAPGPDVTHLEVWLSQLAEIDPDMTIEVAGKVLRWQPVEFSHRWGIEKDPYLKYRYTGPHGLKKRVPLEMVDMGVNDIGASYFIWTSVVPVSAGQSVLYLGGNADSQAWLNGRKVLDAKGDAAVVLQDGNNPLLVKLTEPVEGQILPYSRGQRYGLRAYAGFGCFCGDFTREANWIWCAERTDGECTRHFRRVFDLQDDPANAQLWITGDDRFTVWVNGQISGSDDIWSRMKMYDVTPSLHKGRNVIAVEVSKASDLGGLLVELESCSSTGQREYVRSDDQWQVADSGSAGWTGLGCDDASWGNATVVGTFGKHPWRMIPPEAAEDVVGPLGLKWFLDRNAPRYDLTPQKQNPVGDYRFTAPPGMRSMTISVVGELLGVWHNGEATSSQEIPAPDTSCRQYMVTVSSVDMEASQVAIRIRQQRGYYGGAVFPVPIRIDCGLGRAALGDWESIGLATYSGMVWYGKDVVLSKEQVSCRVMLDMHDVAITAEVHVNGRFVGVRLSRPWKLDITDFVREGENRIEIAVTNTLANHLSVGTPTGYVFDGQTRSGLIGPVRLEFFTKVTLQTQP